ncbi:esterase/lipase family protein [Noviherbaspirillum pedocola]|uniref:Alpha/beta hydrolase n=1 Tax=Noviherbaspirillum pedocola TaxID=2801341 RepID=A0A934SY05_9BURK|nr:alpha/beta hydrolase [Noviherbaspirillum pedocola]MBK4737628.1 alpha/beta hydrolase [Noviherbaspirillum pedocola]
MEQAEPEDDATASSAIPAADDGQRHFHVTDWHGVTSLLLDATEGAIAIAEEVHGAVAETLPPLAPAGITGFAWRGVRACIAVARRGSKALPQRARDAATPEDALPLPTPQRRTALAALNGLLGDRLAATNNPLAIEMGLSLGGIALPLETNALQALLARRPPQAKARQAGERLLLLAHGLCQCELQWHRHRHDHGAALQRDLGLTPLYLSYNSGLHVSENGRALAVMLETLLRAWPAPVRTLTLLGYSMGGLVLRSACRHAELAGHDWISRVDRLVFLGTPHQGTPLARGNWLGAVLGHNRLTAPFIRLASLRSDGINDLRHGTVFDEAALNAGTGQKTDLAHPVPLPENARCHAIAATLGVRVGDLRDRLLGDGLVPVDSALGRHADPARRLDIPDAHCYILHRSHHLDLLSSAQVYRRLRAWLARPRA